YSTVKYSKVQYSKDPSFTTEDDYGDLEDLLCDRSSVREFRARYEPPLFWIITLLGGVGNLTVVWIYLNFPEALQSWNFGPTLCKMVSALYKVNLFSSTLLLTCISVDRYVVIVQTTKAQNSQSERRRWSGAVCVGVWLLALVLATPELVFSSTAAVDSHQYCRMVFPSHVGNRTKTLVLSLQVMMGFCIPVVIMGFCYSVIVARLLGTRNFQKHKAIRVILVVVLVFVMSQLPHNSVLIIKAAQASNATMTNCEEMKRFDVVDQVLKSVAYTHACLNPFLYAFVGVRFRRDVLMLLLRCCRRPLLVPQSKNSRIPLSSTRVSVMSDSDTSQAMSL
uniref:Chemokine (C-C motif) receptor 9a n=1 Tax=Cynoglossus semilaevis TaxID=244447 RepID=A0A3P8W7A2_CYNSE